LKCSGTCRLTYLLNATKPNVVCSTVTDLCPADSPAKLIHKLSFHPERETSLWSVMLKRSRLCSERTLGFEVIDFTEHNNNNTNNQCCWKFILKVIRYKLPEKSYLVTFYVKVMHILHTFSYLGWVCVFVFN